MTHDRQDQTSLEGGAALERILSTGLGEPAPLEDYHRPLSEEFSQQLETRLDDVERAQGEAAKQLPNLYAD